ncbi:MAG: tRNA 4-thiouridine(8) synthase ThiI [Spirochaetia bacterium]|nr:tRNA 4-thiouridine(8) synthase ThiI [Spirochaetia bacterium]
MGKHLFVIRLGEISLKGQNRSIFESRLKTNIKYKLKIYNNRLVKQKGRMYLEVEEPCAIEKIYEVLSSTFGIVGFSPAITCKKDISEILSSAIAIMAPTKRPREIKTFKVETVRGDKSFHLDSYAISREVGHSILEAYSDLKVDVHHPDCTIKVEVRDKVYIHPYEVKGLGGLPVGSAGRGMLMLSGGIDSPVAAYYMAKRGLHQEAVYFHAYPYTSNEAKEKVITLAKILNPYLEGIRLHIIPFTDVQLAIKERGKEEEQTLLMRSAMMNIANSLALSNNCSAIITGEALSQVASQTIESLSFTNNNSNLIVLRPLIGFDKEEIIEVSRRIGTFSTSILPYDDCCVIFSPKHPTVRPHLPTLTHSFKSLKIEELMQIAIENEEIIQL